MLNETHGHRSRLDMSASLRVMASQHEQRLEAGPLIGLQEDESHSQPVAYGQGGCEP